MGLLYSVNFSLTTLLISFILPFAYYSYSSENWYWPDRVKLFNFINIILSCSVCALVFLKILASVQNHEYEQLQLLLLHLGPPVLALMAIARGKNMGLPAILAQAAHGGSGKKDDDDAFKPAAIKSGQVDSVTWEDLIINEDVKQELMSVIKLLKDPKTAAQYGIKVPKGILFSGPPGTGKTSVARAVANTAGLSFFALRPDEIISKWVGESEKNLSRLFETAQKHAPAVIFIDEIDSLGKKRSDKNASHSDNLLNHLLQLMDGVIKSEGIYIIGATNRDELVDDALKRAGRLNRVIKITLPDLESRKKLFELYSKNLLLAYDIDPELLAKATEGNSAADIKEICNQAGLHAFQRSEASGRPSEEHLITSEDFEFALSAFQIEEKDDDFDEEKKSSSPGPVNEQVESLTWDDVIIEDELRSELESVVQLLKDAGTAKQYGIDVPKGILLNGPPGTGKTTLAKIVASTAGLSFFVLKTDEIVSKWVGESEKNLTRLFKAAAKHAPSIIFIDEIDSIAKNRAEGNAQHSDNLLNHLLQLIDGVIKRDGIYIIAATNRADLVDPALKRGGRLNRVIEVPLPGFLSRKALFGMYLEKLKLAETPDYDLLSFGTEGKAAADIRSICNQAGLNSFKRESARGSREYLIQNSDLEQALEEFVPPEVVAKARVLAKSRQAERTASPRAPAAKVKSNPLTK